MASVLLSTWAALSCGGKTDSNAGQPAQNAATTGGQGTGTRGGGGTSATIVSATSTGGRVQEPLDAGAPMLATSGTASSATPTGGMASSVTTQAANTGGSVQEPLDAGLGSAAGQSGSPPDAGTGGLPERLTRLAAQSSWQDLKLLWSRVDEVLPSESTYVTYANTITNEQRDQWLADLSASLGAIEGLGVLHDDEILFLRQVVTARVEVMRDGGYRYEMMLHRSPFPFEGEAEDSIDRLEKKIDTLQSLRERCIIEPDAYRLALEQVEREAITLFVLAQLTEQNVSYDLRIQVPEDLEGADLATEIDRRLEALRVESGDDATKLEKIDAMRARLAAIQSTLQTLPLLTRMLESCT